MDLVGGVGLGRGFEWIGGKPPLVGTPGPRAYLHGSQCTILPGLIFQPGNNAKGQPDTAGSGVDGFTEEEANQILVGEFSGALSGYTSQNDGTMGQRGSKGLTRGGWAYSSGGIVTHTAEVFLGELLDGDYDSSAPATSAAQVFPPGVATLDFAFPDRSASSGIRSGVRAAGTAGGEVVFTPYDSAGAVDSGLVALGANGIRLEAITAPGAPSTAGQGHLYASGSALYYHPNGGSAVDLTAGGGGGLPSGSSGQILHHNGSAWEASNSVSADLTIFGELIAADLDISGDANIDGKLTVAGMIDPTGISFTAQASSPMSGSDRGLWSSNANTRPQWWDGTESHRVAYEYDWWKTTTTNTDQVCWQLQNQRTTFGLAAGFATSLEFRMREVGNTRYTGVITSELSTTGGTSGDMTFRVGFETTSLSGSYVELLRLSEFGGGNGAVVVPQGLIDVQPLGSAPSSPSEGWLYSDSSDNGLHYYDGTSWIDLTASGSTTFADDVFRVQDDADATKQLAFQLSGVTTATTRTLTVPDASGTILIDSDIGIDVQAWDAGLDTYAANPLTAAELGELQNIGATTISAAQWGYLGATGGTIWTSANDGAASGLDADLLDGQQGTYYLDSANLTGVLPLASGGTGSGTAAGARVNLEVEIGVDVQAWDADLDTLAGLAYAQGSLVIGNASANPSELTIGAANSLLHSNGTTASWQAHSILAGTGLQTSGSALALDINGLAAIGGAVDGALDLVAVYDASSGAIVKVPAEDLGGGGVSDHGSLTGLTGTDHHTQYANLGGRSGGQTLQGGTGAGDDLVLISTGHATKGEIIITGGVRSGTDATYDLGTTSQRWRDLYLSGDIEDGTNTFTLPGSTGTLALTSEILDASDLAGTGLEASGGTIRIASAAAGDGLNGGSGSALSVDAGTGLEINAGAVRLAAAAAGEGLTGGGGSALAMDVNGLTAEATPDGAADYVAIYDASAGAHRKMLLSNLPGSGGAETLLHLDQQQDQHTIGGSRTITLSAGELGTDGDAVLIRVAFSVAATGGDPAFALSVGGNSVGTGLNTNPSSAGDTVVMEVLYTRRGATSAYFFGTVVDEGSSPVKSGVLDGTASPTFSGSLSIVASAAGTYGRVESIYVAKIEA